MEIVLALVAGIAIGWLAGRTSVRSRVASGEEKPPKRRLSKRQQAILASLPPDTKRPTLYDLIAEEAESEGVTSIPGADGVPLPVRLQVFRRDEAVAGPCTGGRWRFVLSPSTEPEAAQAEDLQLECRENEGETATEEPVETD